METGALISFVLLLVTSLLSTAVSVVQAQSLLNSKALWKDEIRKFEGFVRSASQKKMDNVVRAYALQVLVRKSRSLKQKETPRFVASQHLICGNGTASVTVPIVYSTVYWLCAKKGMGSLQLENDVLNGHVQFVMIRGGLFRIRVPVAAEIPAAAGETQPTVPTVYFVIALNSSGDAVFAGAPGDCTHTVQAPMTLSDDTDPLSGGDAVVLTHVWAYKVGAMPRVM